MSRLNVWNHPIFHSYSKNQLLFCLIIRKAHTFIYLTFNINYSILWLNKLRLVKIEKKLKYAPGVPLIKYYVECQQHKLPHITHNRLVS